MADTLVAPGSDLEAEKKLLSKLNTWFDSAQRMRLLYEKQWYMNMAFYFGRQWVEWVGGPQNWNSMKLWEPPAPRYRVRLVANRIRPKIRKELSKLTKQNIEYYIMPQSNSEDDLAAARAADMLADYLLDQLKWTTIRTRVTFWSLICGSAFIKHYWDETKVDPSGVQGSICLDAINSFGIFVPNIQDEDLEAQPWLIHAACKDPDWVEDTFNVKVQPDAKLSGNQLEQKFLNSLGMSTSASLDTVYVKEIYIKPCPKFPDGGVIHFCKEKLLTDIGEVKSMKYPYSHGLFPFSKIDHIPTGRFYADSVIVDQIPLQREYNRTRSQLIEAKNRMAKPQLLAPKGSIDANKVTSEPGLVIFYTPGFAAPQPIALSPMPEYVIEEMQRTQQDMDDNSFQNEIARGRTPPSASTVAYLQEEQDTVLNQSVESVETATQNMGYQFLVMVHDYWDAERTIRVIDDDNSFEAFQFSRADILDNTDFRVVSGSGDPKSRAAQVAQIMELAKMGLIDQNKIMKYLNMPETRELYQEFAQTQKQCEREHQRLREMGQQAAMMSQMQQQIPAPGLNMPPGMPPGGMNGGVPPLNQPITGMNGNGGMPPVGMPGMPQQPPPVLPTNIYDDNEGHIDNHSRYMRSQEYEMMPPEMQAGFIAHLQLHINQRQPMMQPGVPGQRPPIPAQQPQPQQLGPQLGQNGMM